MRILTILVIIKPYDMSFISSGRVVFLPVVRLLLQPIQLLDLETQT